MSTNILFTELESWTYTRLLMDLVQSININVLLVI